MTSASAIVARYAKVYGPDLKLLDSRIDGARLLWAIAGAESDFGEYALPRHEPAYCSGHRYDIPALTKRWGCAAHCSYGPWQMMFPRLVDFCSAPQSPHLYVVEAHQADSHFLGMTVIAAGAAVRMLNQEILGRQQARTIQEIAKAWNHGNWRDQFDDSAYVDRAVKFYSTPFPEPEPPAMPAQGDTHVSAQGS